MSCEELAPPEKAPLRHGAGGSRATSHRSASARHGTAAGTSATTPPRVARDGFCVEWQLSPRAAAPAVPVLHGLTGEAGGRAPRPPDAAPRRTEI